MGQSLFHVQYGSLPLRSSAPFGSMFWSNKPYSLGAICVHLLRRSQSIGPSVSEKGLAFCPLTREVGVNTKFTNDFSA